MASVRGICQQKQLKKTKKNNLQTVTVIGFILCCIECISPFLCPFTVAFMHFLFYIGSRTTLRKGAHIYTGPIKIINMALANNAIRLRELQKPALLMTMLFSVMPIRSLWQHWDASWKDIKFQWNSFIECLLNRIQRGSNSCGMSMWRHEWFRVQPL